MVLVADRQITLDPNKVPRCRRCGARAYWSTRAVCLACTLKAEEKRDG